MIALLMVACTWSAPQLESGAAMPLEGFPVAPGEIQVNGGGALFIRYPGNSDLASLITQWRLALQERGWRCGAPHFDPLQGAHSDCEHDEQRPHRLTLGPRAGAVQLGWVTHHPH